MSTTAQGEQQSLERGEGDPAEPITAAAPAPAPTPKDSTREYTLFEEARQDTWTKIGTVVASTQEAAIDSLGKDKLVAAQKENKRFMAIASTYVQPKKPKVEIQTTISYD